MIRGKGSGSLEPMRVHNDSLSINFLCCAYNAGQYYWILSYEIVCKYFSEMYEDLNNDSSLLHKDYIIKDRYLFKGIYLYIHNSLLSIF